MFLMWPFFHFFSFFFIFFHFINKSSILLIQFQKKIKSSLGWKLAYSLFSLRILQNLGYLCQSHLHQEPDCWHVPHRQILHRHDKCHFMSLCKLELDYREHSEEAVHLIVALDFNDSLADRLEDPTELDAELQYLVGVHFYILIYLIETVTIHIFHFFWYIKFILDFQSLDLSVHNNFLCHMEFLIQPVSEK